MKSHGQDFKYVVKALRPSDQELYPYREAAGELPNYAPNHILNTKTALREQHKQLGISACAFESNFFLTGYADGVICMWSLEQQEGGFVTTLIQPWLGHINKIN